MSRVFFYLPRSGSIATPFPEFIDRWRIYSSKLLMVSSESSIVLLTDSKFESDESSSFRVRKLPKNRLLQLVKLASIISKDHPNQTLISGNNFDALLISLILKAIRPHLKLQASLHAEIDAINKITGPKSIIKGLILRLFLPRVNSLRLVRPQEVPKAQKLFAIPAEKIVVCPVPIEVPENLPISQSKNIGFLGRIHSERSPEIWAQIALELAQRRPELNFFIAGSGSDQEKMVRMLAPIEPRVHFLGHVAGPNLEKFWSSIGLLLLTAQHESYGMAAREALLRGKRIVARKIDAYRGLVEVAPSLVQLFDNKEEALAIIDNIDNFEINEKEVIAFRKQFELEQNKQLEALARSWI